MATKADDDLRRQRTKMLLMALPAPPIAVGLWLAIYYWGPVPGGIEAPVDRLVFAIKCSCVAVLLCFFSGLEAVSHERLVTKAINPLVGAESARMRVNLRYLQNTLEQLLLFIPGLLALSQYSIRAVTATSCVWIVSRVVFWIGYLRSPLLRAPGLMGMAQSAIVLVYVCYKFGYELAGLPGALVVPGLLVLTELFVVRWTSKPPA